jgi:hypothetical protein
MKMKKKVLAILMVLMFFAIPFSFAQAGDTTWEQSNSTISVEMVTLNEDGSFITEIFTMTGEELAEFESTVANIMDAIESTSTWEEILNIFENLPQQQGIISSIISFLLSRLRNLRNRGFVFSLGHSYKLNPFKKSGFKIRQRSKFWYYTNGAILKDRTIILKPFAIKLQILTGRQLGRIASFWGVYIYIAKRFPQKSTTFFMGTARSINGRELFSFGR